MTRTVQFITIPVYTDMDPSTLLDIAIELISDITSTIESYGETGYILEEEISVVDEDEENVVGGEQHA
tara:strand:+ start:105 stop:308 length:204 start_codon:yes stop_codon:yes gene_type:complete